MASDLISTQDAANILGVDRRSIVRYIKDGRIEAKKIGRGYAVSEASVLEFKKKWPHLPKDNEGE